MTGAIIISIITGALYGWAAAYQSEATRLIRPQILHSRLVNLIISFSALATVILTGIVTGSLLNGAVSFGVIFLSGMVVNLYHNHLINNKFQ